MCHDDTDEEETGEQRADDLIVTPGPREEPNTTDKQLIKRDSEGTSSPEEEKQNTDEDYVPTDSEGTDGDDESEGESEDDTDMTKELQEQTDLIMAKDLEK